MLPPPMNAVVAMVAVYAARDSIPQRKPDVGAPGSVHRSIAERPDTMATLRDARMLTRYNAWADKLMFDAVAGLPDGEATKPRTSLPVFLRDVPSDLD